MSKEIIHSAIVLKKQPFGEADEIVTFFTEEAGKVRCLAKSVKFQKSRLQHSLQACFFVRAVMTKSRLPKLIGAEVKNSFPGIRENLEAAKAAFYALEAVLKGTPDEQKNEHLFFVLKEFFIFLDLRGSDRQLTDAGLAKFKLEFLSALGFAVRLPENAAAGGAEKQEWGFSFSKGGFVPLPEAEDRSAGGAQALSLCRALSETAFYGLAGGLGPPDGLSAAAGPLNTLLSRFINYQLEREMRSEKYL